MDWFGQLCNICCSEEEKTTVWEIFWNMPLEIKVYYLNVWLTLQHAVQNKRQKLVDKIKVKVKYLNWFDQP